jgi:hypothetical protein
MNDAEETQPGTNSRWPFQKVKRAEHAALSTQLADLRSRVDALEHADREKSASIEAHRLEIAELKAMASEQRAKNEAVLAKLDLGFTTITTLLKGERGKHDPLGDFR